MIFVVADTHARAKFWATMDQNLKPTDWRHVSSREEYDERKLEGQRGSVIVLYDPPSRRLSDVIRAREMIAIQHWRY
jgi:hypothetical protein